MPKCYTLRHTDIVIETHVLQYRTNSLDYTLRLYWEVTYSPRRCFSSMSTLPSRFFDVNGFDSVSAAPSAPAARR